MKNLIFLSLYYNIHVKTKYIMSIRLDKVQPKNKIQLKQLVAYAFKHNIYDLNFIDTSKITDMSELFININHNFDVSSWDVSNVTDMHALFYECNKFTGKGLENWNVSNVTDTRGMFKGCNRLTIPYWYDKL